MIEAIGLSEVIGVIAALCALFVLYRIHKSDDNEYNIADLISTREHLDLDKLCQLGAFLVSSWIVIHMELHARTVEWAVTLYMLAWVGARFASLWRSIKGGAIKEEKADAVKQ